MCVYSVSVSAYHKFDTYLDTYPPTYSPRAKTHMQHKHNHWGNVLHFAMCMCVYSLTASAY